MMMKRGLVLFSTVLMVLLIGVYQKAQAAPEDFSYQIGIDGGLSITGYSGASGDLVVPQQIDGKQVTSIAKEAFFNNGRIVRVILPEGLTKIGASAFQGTKYLEEITLPNTLRIIEQSAFNSCGSLKSIIIPQGVTSIAENTFLNCKQLSQVSLPVGLKTIAEKAFAVTGLKEVQLPLGLESIGNHAFYGCRYLAEITLPNTVKSIDRYAFFVCDSLRQVILPTSLQSMSEGVFDKCPSLELIAIPMTVTNIRPDAFFSGSLRSSKLTITAPSGSTAAKYAQQTGIPFIETSVTSSVIMTLDGIDMSGEKRGIDLSSESRTLYLQANTHPETLWPGVIWRSSKPAVASVDDFGQITAYKKGEAIITATAADGSGVKASFTLNVANLAKEINIYTATNEDSIQAKGKITLKATVLPESTDNKSVLWSVSDSSVASISAKGLFTAADVGEKKSVQVIATAKDGSGVSATHDLYVYPLVSEIKVLMGGHPLENKETLSIDIASQTNSIQLDVYNSPSDSLQRMKWESSAKKIAEVDENGLITGLRKGKAIITATTMDGTRKKMTFTVNVSNIVKDVIISGNSAVASGQKIKLSAIVLPEDATDKSILWESSDDTIAKINKNNGEVTARKVESLQQVIITATARDGSGVQAQMELFVHPLVESIVLTQDDIVFKDKKLDVDLADTNSVHFSAIIEPLNAMQEIRWQSSDERIASIDDVGNITLLKKGKVRITATANDGSRVRATVELNISNSNPQ